jgi:hypothetical protein
MARGIDGLVVALSLVASSCDGDDGGGGGSSGTLAPSSTPADTTPPTDLAGTSGGREGPRLVRSQEGTAASGRMTDQSVGGLPGRLKPQVTASFGRTVDAL